MTWRRTALALRALLALGCAAPLERADAGTPDDAGGPLDPIDAAEPADAGSPPDDARSPPDAEPDAAAPPPCELAPDAPLVLLYASVGREDNLRFLREDCAVEVVVGEKREDGPRSVMARPSERARGGRSGYVSDLNGQRIRDALRRENGVARTAAELMAILDAGYDYIVIDEITAHPDWADGSPINRRFRALLEVLPPRTVIAYVSLDLTMASSGAPMNARRQLLYALQQRARAIALEVYLHTSEVRAGLAPDALRRAAIRLREAVLGLPGGGHINERAITVLGMSTRSEHPQYRYLDQPAHDLWSVRTQARAVRTYGALLGSQRGLGYYFVGHSDLVPVEGAPYDFDDLIDVMVEEANLTALAADTEEP